MVDFKSKLKKRSTSKSDSAPILTLADYWYRFIREVLLDLPTFYMSSTGRKYVANATMVVPGEAWHAGFPLSINDLGYKGKDSKINQLKRIYYNEEAVEAARDKLTTRSKEEKDFTSVAIPTMSNKKDHRSQGYCMNSIVITHIPKGPKVPEALTYITIFYRITEVIQKFGADLIFLNQLVIPEILQGGYKITEVRLQFTNAYFSPLFFPVLYHFVDPVELMEELENRMDNPGYPALFKSCLRAAALPFIQGNPDHYKYRMRRLMHLLALSHLEAGRISRDKMMEFISQREELNSYVAKLASSCDTGEDD